MNYLTPDGFKKLREELKHLKETRRIEIAHRLKEAAAFGDLTENAEYVDAKEEQTFLERRIEELEATLRNAKIIDRALNTSNVAVGHIVELYAGQNKYVYQLVGEEQADPINGKISPKSPIGKALMGRKQGDSFSIATPKGKKRYKVTKIS